jgi:hypothetical protein
MVAPLNHLNKMTPSKHPIKVDGKFLEMLVNIVRDQNIQLLTEIAENEKLSKRQLLNMVPLKFALKSELMSFVSKPE